MRHPAAAPLALLVALIASLVGAAAVAVLEPARRPAPGPAAHPAASRPARPVPPPVLAGVAAAPLPVPAKLALALRAPAAAAALGPELGGLVADARTGRPLYASRVDVPAPPASTLKLATAVAALSVLGPAATLDTRVVQGPGAQIVLVGGGDPGLASPGFARLRPGSAALDGLAAATARRLRRSGVRTVRLGLDATRYPGPVAGPGWKPGYFDHGDVAPVTALMVDEGRVQPDAAPRYADPVAAAGRSFAALLARYGVAVAGLPSPARAPAGAPVLARVSSATVADLIEVMLTVSDNNLAEALGREVAGRLGLPRTFAGEARALPLALAQAGLSAQGIAAYDASGLSVFDRATPRVLVRLLTAIVDRPVLRAVVPGLPVAGLTGTLADRYGGPAQAAAGIVRAKTGTLLGVSTLAGLVVDRDGALLAFAFLAPSQAALWQVEPALDALAATLAGCGCR